MRKGLSFCLVFLVFCSSLGAQSPSISFEVEMPKSPTSNYSEMDVASLLSILSQDLEEWNNDSISQEEALRRAYNLLKTTSQELATAQNDISEIKKSLPLLEQQLATSQAQKISLQKNNGTLKIIGAASTTLAAGALGFLFGGWSGAGIGMTGSVLIDILFLFAL